MVERAFRGQVGNDHVMGASRDHVMVRITRDIVSFKLNLMS